MKKKPKIDQETLLSEDSSKDTKSAYPYSIKIPVIDKNGNKKDKILVVTGAINEKYDNKNSEKISMFLKVMLIM